MPILHFDVGDTLIMKKKHPCGGDRMMVVRTGSDVRIRCIVCGRDITIPRLKLESGIKRIERETDV